MSLDASQSFDPDGHQITFFWKALNGGRLSVVDQPVTTFEPGQPGSFVVYLKVQDEFGLSASKDIRIFVEGGGTSSQLPQACIRQPNLTTRIFEPVWLDGSCSSDPNSKSLSYLWQAVDGGSIMHADSVSARFSSEVAGKYVVQLVVRNSLESSAPALATIDVLPNQPPVAFAGQDDTTHVGVAAILDGSGSSDPDGDPLTQFLWQTHDGGTIADPNRMVTTFFANEAMTYTLTLSVFDGFDWSAPDFVNITVIDTSQAPVTEPPVANAGPDTTYLLGETEFITLDGSRSLDPQGLPLNYYWKGVETNPSVIDPDDVMTPTFPLPPPGKYVFLLTVFNGSQYSKTDQVLVTVEDPDVFVSKTRPLGGNVFRTISAALDFANPGDLILIEPGTYPETVDNFKDGVTLLGLNPAVTVVDGDPSGSSFLLKNVSGVTIRKLTIRDGGRVDPAQIDVAGLSCFQCTDIRILNNNIVENRGDGVRLVSSEAVSLKNNEIVRNAFNGIRSSSSNFEAVENHFIDNSTAADLSDVGAISIESVGGDASSFAVSIQNNEFTGNKVHHIQAATNSSVTVSNNTFTSGGTGIFSTPNSGVILTVINNSFNAL